MLAILSFLSGNAFRLIFGEVVAAFKEKREHEAELERMKLQGELDAAAHARNLEAIRVQHQLGVEIIHVQAEAAHDAAQDAAFAKAVEDVGKKTGYKWLDIWNGSIRPGLATLAALAVIAEVVALSFVLNEWHQSLIGSILGIYVANRDLSKRGK